jgi:hypothetical protein
MFVVAAILSGRPFASRVEVLPVEVQASGNGVAVVRGVDGKLVYSNAIRAVAIERSQIVGTLTPGGLLKFHAMCEEGDPKALYQVRSRTL